MNRTTSYAIGNDQNNWRAEVHKWNKLVTLFEEDKNDTTDQVTFRLGKFPYQKLFVGKSEKSDPIAQVDVYTGSEYDGNTLLLEQKPLTYLFIGNDVWEFRTRSPIVTYRSPIGRGRVAYPYAIDSQNRYYLLKDKAEIENIPMEWSKDPYEYYEMKLQEKRTKRTVVARKPRQPTRRQPVRYRQQPIQYTNAFDDYPVYDYPPVPTRRTVVRKPAIKQQPVRYTTPAPRRVAPVYTRQQPIVYDDRVVPTAKRVRFRN